MSTAAPITDPCPRMYRAMKTCPVDGLPVIGSTSSGQLGVRLGVDIECDAAGNVVIDGAGMSVTPAWQMLPYSRVPRRLKDRFPGATGSNNTACYFLGASAFVRSPVTNDLELIPDSPTHGVVAPASSMTCVRYNDALAETRPHWVIDES
jgi:hypothetical protein